ncbi:MAG: DUF1549 and DUF1553 domain-containing protein [Isosphaeraceae bacterium]|nr:DUF1549 and DUF1553 domain-containing protein [Isosphaeraceae bacterium]
MRERPLRMLTLALVCLAVAGHAHGEDPPERPITADERAHWAYQPIQRVVPPAVDRSAEIRNPIDAFIAARLAEFGIEPNPPADRATLLRRLRFDLTGLPPRPDELDRFLADDRPDAYEGLVDRLLASPEFAERQAQHWLDLARYADSDGFEFDQARPNAWRYRDGVVAAFATDMPYDRFVREQLAGDEIAPGSNSAFIAGGFNRCYPDMVDLNDQRLRRQNALNDITDTVGLVFLGLTVGCARCHDHKTDAIRQVDYYRLQAVFAPARFRDDHPIMDSLERVEFEERVARHRAETAELRRAILAVEEPIRRALTPNPVGTVTDDVVAALERPNAERDEAELELAHRHWSRDSRISASVWRALLSPGGDAARRLQIDVLGAVLAREPRPPAVARGIDEVPGPSPATHLLIRGELARPGPIVEPEMPAVLRRGTWTPKPTERSSGRRRALADWLVDRDNPLTARVAVNRIWQIHFGRGIVATPSDFGVGGVEPTHPELLDHLALEFMDRGWSMKAIHRMIVTSATYRRSSRANPAAARIDPENQLLARRDRRRLDGEAIRDALLACAGDLSRAAGGPPVFPELPAELTKLSSKGSVWPVSRSAVDRNRRSIYVFVRRNLRYPFFEVFDRPDTNASCPKRSVSTIAPQALTLFNGELAQSAARSAARRVATSYDESDRPRALFRLGFGREPTAHELTIAREFLAAGGSERLADLALAIMNATEFVYID